MQACPLHDFSLSMDCFSSGSKTLKLLQILFESNAFHSIPFKRIRRIDSQYLLFLQLSVPLSLPFSLFFSFTFLHNLLWSLSLFLQLCPSLPQPPFPLPFGPLLPRSATLSPISHLQRIKLSQFPIANADSNDNLFGDIYRRLQRKVLLLIDSIQFDFVQYTRINYNIFTTPLTLHISFLLSVNGLISIYCTPFVNAIDISQPHSPPQSCSQ